jgi:hypothetical protein
VKTHTNKVLLSLLLGVLLLGLFSEDFGWAQEIEQIQKAQTEENAAEELIVPAPKDIKEAIAIYVFLGWMWLSIFVLVYILRQKIKELDRIYKLKFFSSHKN